MSEIPAYPDRSPAVLAQADLSLKVITEVMAERTHQIEIGYAPTLDDVYISGELASASAAYALNANGSTAAPLFWPWPGHTWQPADARRDLVRAAALAIAEIERLDRLEPQAVSA